MPLNRENRRRQITLNVSPYVIDVDAVALSLINQFKADGADPEVTKLGDYKLSLTFRENPELTYEVACQKILWNQYVQDIEQKNITNSIELLRKLVDPYFDSPVVAGLNDKEHITAMNKDEFEKAWSPEEHDKESHKEYINDPPELESLIGHLMGRHGVTREDLEGWNFSNINHNDAEEVENARWFFGTDHYFHHNHDDVFGNITDPSDHTHSDLGYKNGYDPKWKAEGITQDKWDNLPYNRGTRDDE